MLRRLSPSLKQRASVPRPSSPSQPFSQSSPSADSPPPAGGHAPSVANSAYLRTTREDAMKTGGLIWRDEDTVSVGSKVIAAAISSRQVPAERETKKMNMYQAIRDAMSLV